MSDILVADGFPRAETWGVLSSGSSTGTLITGAGAGVEGAWAELKASTGFETSYIVVTMEDPSGGNTINLDLAVGAAGSEVSIATDLYFRTDVSSHLRSAGISYLLPIRIPAGSRVAARIMGAAASRTVRVAVQAFGGTEAVAYQGLDYIGGIFTTTGGTNSKGAWQLLNASTSRAYKALHVVWGTLDFNSNTSSTSLIDLGIGAASSEVVVVPDLYSACSNVSGVAFNTYLNGLIKGYIPAGTRVAMRAQSTGNSANRYCVLYVYGYY